MFMYDRLVVVSDGEVEPYLAESWTVSPTSVEFTMRDDVKCEDGTALTPSAIAASMNRTLDPSTKSTIAPSLFPGGATFAADDAAGTFTVTTPEPNPALLVTFANPVMSVVCPAGLADPSKLGSASFGTGPYVLKDAVAGTSYTLKKRDGYEWGPQPHADNLASLPETVTARVLQNETTAANVFLQGDLDVTLAQVESAAERLQGKDYIEKTSPFAFAFLIFNQAGAPGSDPAVRTAIAQAVDPSAYATSVRGDLATPSANLMPDETVCAQTDGADYRPEFDLDEARKTLEGAGYALNSDGVFEKGGKPLTLRVGSHNQEGIVGDYLAQTLEDLGAVVQSEQVELPAYIESVKKGDWDVYAGTIVVLDSPAALGQTLFGPSGLDLGTIRNDEFEQNMAAAGRSSDFDQACELWMTAQDALVENVDLVPQAELNNIYVGNGVDFSFGFSGLIEPTSLVRK
ncbi:ABC transporter substrate-binding protein [Nocardioides endophyticus]